MKLTTLLSVTLFTASQGVLAADALLDDARNATKQFGKALKSEVVKSMKATGPVGTITVCNERAPQIAKEVSAETGWDIGRTSLKLRNPANAPDAWELAVLNSFEKRKAGGEPVKTLEYSEVVENDGAKTFRYMKAIPTGKPCLNCHAAEIKPEVEANLARLYPDDKARGFKLGDIRGAFTLSRPM
jgi:hypothetical protein